MELQFLGTGAAEGVPPLFSRTEHTTRIRREGGRDLRTRSALRMGDEYQIDFGPDAFFQSVRCDCDYYDLRHLIVTHMHHDHFQPEAVMAKDMPYDTNGEPIAIYASRPAIDWLRRVAPALLGRSAGDADPLGDHYPLVPLDYFGEHRIGELTVHAVRGNHVAMSDDEFPVNPLVTFPNGKRLLYAVDTGYYDEESWEFLAGHRVDRLVMEATFGGRTDRDDEPSGHLDAFSFVRAVERMASIGLVDETTPIYATHINPKHPWDHGQLEAFFRSTDFMIRVAYDCLKLSV
ncbi:MAG: MBL fold metallo-hydrolase [Spirochaetota bacterium]